jgi:hypothetical protein
LRQFNYLKAYFRITVLEAPVHNQLAPLFWNVGEKAIMEEAHGRTSWGRSIEEEEGVVWQSPQIHFLYDLRTSH